MNGWQELVELESENDVTCVDQKEYSNFISFVVTIARKKRVPAKLPLTWSCPFQRFINSRSSLFRTHPILCASLTEYCERKYPRSYMRDQERLKEEVSSTSAS